MEFIRFSAGEILSYWNTDYALSVLSPYELLLSTIFKINQKINSYPGPAKYSEGILLQKYELPSGRMLQQSQYIKRIEEEQIVS